MSDNSAERIERLEAEVAALRSPPHMVELPSPPILNAFAKEMEQRQRDAIAARKKAEIDASRKRREDAERQLPKLRRWRRRLDAADAALAQLAEERRRLEDLTGDVGRQRLRILYELRPTVEALQLLDELARAGEL